MKDKPGPQPGRYIEIAKAKIQLRASPFFPGYRKRDLNFFSYAAWPCGLVAQAPTPSFTPR